MSDTKLNKAVRPACALLGFVALTTIVTYAAIRSGVDVPEWYVAMMSGILGYFYGARTASKMNAETGPHTNQ